MYFSQHVPLRLVVLGVGSARAELCDTPDPYVFVLHAELVKFNYLLITGIS